MVSMVEKLQSAAEFLQELRSEVPEGQWKFEQVDATTSTVFSTEQADGDNIAEGEHQGSAHRLIAVVAGNPILLDLMESMMVEASKDLQETAEVSSSLAMLLGATHGGKHSDVLRMAEAILAAKKDYVFNPG